MTTPGTGPRDAASVVLTRQGAGGVEVFLIRRVPRVAFAPGFTVFPGGGVDPGDWSLDLQAPIGWSAQFGETAERASALGHAAVRELFEECGVLLAEEAPTSAGWLERALAERERIAAKQLVFADFLAQEGLAPSFAPLRPIAHWITPVSEPRRFDTRFFLAVLPEGQEADGHTSESAQSIWRKPAEALDPMSAEPCLLLPPTWSLLRRLARHNDIAELIAELDTNDAPIPTIMPEKPAEDGPAPEDGARWLFPDADEYHAWASALGSR